MQLNPICQPGLSTSLMGVIKGVAGHLGIPVSEAGIFGMTGHAFLINIHDVVCPSGPYCWNYEGLFRLLKNIGITVEDLGFYQPDSTQRDRGKVESAVRSNIDRGRLCSVLNMDHQLIAGYNDDSFILCVPWPECSGLTPETLTFGTWKEFGDDFHCQFFAFEKSGTVQLDTAIRDSLRYALELFKTPERYSAEPYVMGLNAYDQWCRALEEGKFDVHGNQWNATVWSECRTMAAKYMDEIGARYGKDVELLSQQMSAAYWVVAQNLAFIGDANLSVDRKIHLLEDTRELEAGLIPRIEMLLSMLKKVCRQR